MMHMCLLSVLDYYNLLPIIQGEIDYLRLRNFQPNDCIFFSAGISDINSKKQSDTSCGCKNGRPKQYCNHFPSGLLDLYTYYLIQDFEFFCTNIAPSEICRWKVLYPAKY